MCEICLQSSICLNGSCICSEGFIHDQIYFHDENCAMSSDLVFIWFVLHSIMTFGLTLLLVLHLRRLVTIAQRRRILFWAIVALI